MQDRGRGDVVAVRNGMILGARAGVPILAAVPWCACPAQLALRLAEAGERTTIPPPASGIVVRANETS